MKAWFRVVPVLILASMMAACGGGSSSTKIGAPAKVELSPTTLSLELGKFALITAAVTDAKGTANNVATVTWTSSNIAVATVSTKGAVCAGTWDSLTTPVVCTPGAVGTANITATAGSVTSAATVVNTHPHIANLTVTADTSPACVSQTQTLHFSLKALDGSGADITPTIGTPSWGSLDNTIATVDANGLATAKRPGVTSVFATVGSVVSTPVSFFTCPPQTLTIFTKDVTPQETSFTLAAAGTKQLAFTAIDTLGNPITDLVLTYTSAQPGAATVNSLTGLVTAVAAGRTTVVASCSPPTCNSGLGQAIFSNVVTATVSGSSNNRVLVTGTNATTVVPIDSSTNVAGTAVSIPTITLSGVVTNLKPNSIVFAPDGTSAFIGTDQGLLQFDAVGNTFLPGQVGLTGNVLAVSNNGLLVVVGRPGIVTIFNTTTKATTQFALANPTAAAFSPDGLKAFIVSGSDLFVYSQSIPTTTITLPGAANDVTMLPQGPAFYLAGGDASAITSRVTCTNLLLNTLTTSSSPLFIKSNLDSTHVFAVDTANLFDVTVNVTSPACPPTITDSLATFNLGATIAPRQLIVASDGVHVYVTSDNPNVLTYNATTNAVGSIALSGGATSATTGGVTLDSAQLYVGAAGTNDVHRIDVATGLDIQAIAVGLKKPDGSVQVPDLVAVRPR